MIRPDDRLVGRVTAHLSSVESQLTRAMLWWTAVDLAESQVIAVADLVDLADRHLRPETHPLVLEGVLRSLQLVVRRYAEPAEVAPLLAVVADIARGAVDGADPALAPGAVPRARPAQRGHRPARRLAGPRRRRPERAVGGGPAPRRARRPLPRRAGVRARQVGLGPPRRPHRAGARADGRGEGRDVGAADERRPGQPRVRRRRRRLLGLGAGRPGPPLPRPLRHRRPRRSPGARARRWPTASATPSRGCRSPRDVRLELRAAVAEALAAGDVPTVLARAWNDALDDLDRTL